LTETANDTVVLYAVWTVNNLVNASPPDITKQPAAINEIYHGDTIELTVTATLPTSGGHLTYQWYKKANAQDNGGTSLGTENGASTATYNTPTSLAVATYYYYCVVTNTDTSVNGNHTASATSGTAKVIVYGVGSGTKENPFIVHNVTTLERVGKGEGEWADWSLSAYYKQIKDIDLASVPNWTPIGTNIGDDDWSSGELVIIPENSFIGSYDGNGKTIRNLKIYEPSVEYPQGLFGCIGSGYEENVGVVKNVGIVNCDIKGNNSVGGVVGENYGTVEYCYATGTVSGNNQVGGVVGGNCGTVQNCYSTGVVSGNYCGGVVGRNYVDRENYGTVQNCYSTGDVSGSYCGGVVGYSSERTVQNCYATGTVTGGPGVLGWGYPINCVALNPNIISDSNEVGRVAWRGSTSGIFYDDRIIYGRIDMKKNGDTWIGGEGGNNGTDITSDDWGSADWWSETNLINDGYDNYYQFGPLFNKEVWDFSDLDGTNLPKLKGMPGGMEAQNPVIITIP